jgi:hypothetical protein
MKNSYLFDNYFAKFWRSSEKTTSWAKIFGQNL